MHVCVSLECLVIAGYKDSSRMRSIAFADERNQSLCLFDLHDLINTQLLVATALVYCSLVLLFVNSPGQFHLILYFMIIKHVHRKQWQLLICKEQWGTQINSYLRIVLVEPQAVKMLLHKNCSVRE